MGVLGPLSAQFYQTLGRPEVTRTALESSEFKNLHFETSLGIIDVLRGSTIRSP